MKLFSFGVPESFYLLTFPDNRPEWKLCRSGRCEEINQPRQNSRLPILAVIPDRYFFFYKCRNIQAKKRKTLIKAAEMQLKHVFPGQDPEYSPEIMDTGSHILGVFRGTGLASFLHKHQDDLRLAGTVTTPFLLGLAVMSDRNIPCWTMHNPDDPSILVRPGALEYFYGDIHELEQRIDNQECDHKPEKVNFEELAARLSAPIAWARLKLSLPEFESAKGQARVLLKTALGLLLIGLLFCMGNFFHLRSAIQEKTAWQQKLHRLYTNALGQNYGPDPYGLLLYHADQSAGNTGQGLDFLELLGHLSRAAPQSLAVESMSLSMDSGTLKATLDNYGNMEKLLKDLKTYPEYNFTLDQADSSDSGISVTLSFSY